MALGHRGHGTGPPLQSPPPLPWSHSTRSTRTVPVPLRRVTAPLGGFGRSHGVGLWPLAHGARARGAARRRRTWRCSTCCLRGRSTTASREGPTPSTPSIHPSPPAKARRRARLRAAAPVDRPTPDCPPACLSVCLSVCPAVCRRGSRPWRPPAHVCVQPIHPPAHRRTAWTKGSAREPERVERGRVRA